MVTRWEVTKAVRNSDLPSASRLIMLTLADSAETGTAEIPPRFTPSLRILADETGLDRSTVKRHLASLEESGWIVRSRPDAKAQWNGERTRYRLDLPGGMEPPEVGAQEAYLGAQDTQGGRTEPPGVGAQDTGGRRTVRHLETDPSDLSLTNVISTSPRKRATRIPDDFAVTPEMVAWAKDRMPRVDGRRETEKFINYWQAKSGKDATKHDWDKTWRNWMLNAAERLPSTNGNGNRSSGANRHIDQLTPEERAARNPFTGAVRASQVASGGAQ